MTVAFVVAALVAFVGLVGVVLGPRERPGDEFDEGTGFLDWALDAAMDGWAVSTSMFRRASASRFGDWCFTTLFLAAALCVFLPVGLSLRAVSALRKAVQA